nr:uncharacterized protein C1orf186 homolog isoform X2 [Castor canadensis]XP_020036291.1 uncharacterized protein C1orf186 homolog isoform X2 [Castor canadensis]XP_020036292.1 uncharacterized protein C1orf186 homolog isoform X2 [Castor canadensis]XP_020036293.1 uncharacterized protein C1orf186 homolog isoform X2 [Castor canadensis]XP_020036294.1 uncharacterized protein C1orf186 homolog isoform X2 [Castor canadensis]
MSIMLTGDMELWHGLVIAAASLFLHSCLLIAITYLLRRHIAHQTERILKETRLQACRPSPTHCYSPATKDMKATWTGRGTPVSAPRYRSEGQNPRHKKRWDLLELVTALDWNLCLELVRPEQLALGTLPLHVPVDLPFWRQSLLSTDDSDTSSDSSPPTCQATKDVNYTQVVFSAPEELNKESFLDYEDVKETMDYVNVNPKSHKPNNWTCPTVSEPVEYTQVAM